MTGLSTTDLKDRAARLNAEADQLEAETARRLKDRAVYVRCSRCGRTVRDFCSRCPEAKS